MSNPYESSTTSAIPPEKPFVPRAARVFAALLMVGGVSFLVTTAWVLLYSQRELVLGITGVILFVAGLVFGYTGFQLWKGQSWAYKAAFVLYVIQIPVISGSVITYSLMSGFALFLSMTLSGDAILGFNFHFGGNLQLWLGSDAQPSAIGINLVGAVGARYLYEINRDLKRGVDLEKRERPELSAVLAKLSGAKKMVYVPVTQDGDGEPIDSKFSGVAAVSDSHPWPECPGCKQKMQLFWQLDLSDPGVKHGYPDNEGLLQFFYCVSSEPLCEDVCQSYAPFSRATAIRVVPREGARAGAPPEGHFPAKRIVAWKVVEDYPGWGELNALNIQLSDDETDVLCDHYPLQRDKVGGWPYWVQGVEYPKCPECSQRMEYLLQVDSEINIPYMFGDAGVGHLTYCRKHPEIMSFHWACH